MISPWEQCREMPCRNQGSWGEFQSPAVSPMHHNSVIAPPPMFQDTPPLYLLERYATKLVEKLLLEAVEASMKVTWSIPCSQVCHMFESSGSQRRRSLTGGRWSGLRLCWTPELQPYNPCHRRLSSSQTSLSVRGDDNSFISSALSHDALHDVYADPCESDSYAVPVDVVRPVPRGPRRIQAVQKECSKNKPRSSSAGYTAEPIHLTLQEVRQYLHNLYSSGSEANHTLGRISKVLATAERNNNDVCCHKTGKSFVDKVKNKTKDIPSNRKPQGTRMRLPNLKQTLCSVFRLRKLPTPTQCLGRREAPPTTDEVGARLSGQNDPPSPITKPPFIRRALPPLPVRDVTPSPPTDRPSDLAIDFAASIQKVKDYGWYWGPISGETAERILSDEPDGSFIVRDSSDDYYIFSLTFKLNSIVRHVRIEHDQGNFSFGNMTRFKSHTIVDFIESAVEHSRSGRYLFFLHRRPVLGPMRVQLLHPVSRFKEVQSLQHMCRFVILKFVRRDLIPDLPLPPRVVEYLSTPHYYTEHILEGSESPHEDITCFS